MLRTDAQCRWIMLRHVLAGAAALLMLCLAANASGPRYVSGPPYFTGIPGLPVGWAQSDLRYYTDPGNLGASVNHVAADAMVAAAAGVWNVPVARITVSRGGALAEHVSGANVYLGSNGLVFPEDVQSTNSSAIAIAIVYDTDGSVTDTLLGAGASLPSGCRQNAVTESVDGFDPAGYITHAIIVLNGRCTGSAPQQQLQMQYQLERVFGRVLGLAWSQTNDNVFTGIPQPTFLQALHWPIMHPIDIVCGPYSYQCLPSPFQLRDDDVASLVLLYPVAANAVPAGKQYSLANADSFLGTVSFPTGEGMAGVNVLARRQDAGTGVADSFFAVSGVSGTQFRRADVSPFVAQDTGAQASEGGLGANLPGLYHLPYVPLGPGVSVLNFQISTEALNPLYRGSYSVGPYPAAAVTPSGTLPVPPTLYYIGPGYNLQVDLPVPDAAQACGDGLDGTLSQPTSMPVSGSWTGLLCGYGHAAYTALNIRAGRTFTVEVTALDEQGAPTQAKAMPVLALASPSDPAGVLPTLGVSASAFQGRTTGTTVLAGHTAALPAQTTQMRLGIADQRGDGRPDFLYAARVFYADSVLPARVGPAGATVKIRGSGFRRGNGVTVKGVPATVSAWTASELTLAVPSMKTAGANDGEPVDLVVFDPGTGASSTMTGALLYTAAPSQPNVMRLVQAPQGVVDEGVAAAVPFTVQVLASDGATPVAGEPVTFSSSGNTVSFGACSSLPCTVTTDAQGMASTSISPQQSGSTTLTAADGLLQQTATFKVAERAFFLKILAAPSGSADAGVRTATPFVVREYGADGQTEIAGRTITFSVVTGQATFDACSQPTCAFTADLSGAVVAFLTPRGAGPITLEAVDGALSVRATFTGITHLDTMILVQRPAPTLYVNQGSGEFRIRVMHDDGSPNAYAPVIFGGSPGLHVGICGLSACTLQTDTGGERGLSVLADLPGTYTVTATFGSLSQSATIEVTVPQQTLHLISAPSGNQPVGAVASVPFSARVLEADGVTPVTGIFITLGGPNDAVRLDCGDGDCQIPVDSNGVARSGVTPLRPGPIVLNASSLNLVVSTSFTAVGANDVIWVVSAPSGPVFTGDPIAIEVQVFGKDGTTPTANRNVQFSVTDGSFPLSCGSAACSALTDVQGLATVSGQASAPGTISIQAAEGGASVKASFTAVTRPDLLQVVAAPLATAFSGESAGNFSVRALLPDGVTAAPGRIVTFWVANGTARLGLCVAAPCTVTTDIAGMASITVTPTSTGTVQVKAGEGNATVNASMLVQQRPDVLKLLSAPGPSGYAGVIEPVPFTVGAFLADGVTGVPGRSVTISVTQGGAALSSCGGKSSCTLITDAAGTASTGVTPLAPGTITLVAVDQSATQTASFLALSRPDTLTLVSAPPVEVALGTISTAAFAARLMQGDGVTPEAGKPIVFSSGGNAVFTACGTATCMVMTDSQGVAATTLSPSSVGSISLSATFGALTVSAAIHAFARLDVMSVVSAPTGRMPVGATATFSVRLFQADGVTPDAGQAIQFSSGGAASFAACGWTACRLTTDGSGVASSPVVPLAAGTVVLGASWTGAGTAAGLIASQTASFQAFDRPRGMLLESAPADGALVGDPAPVAFAIRLLEGDGSTPSAHQNVTIAVTNGSARLSACPSSPSCVLTTDDSGRISTFVIPLAAGTITLLATQGSVSVSASFGAVDQPDTIELVSAPSGQLPTRVSSKAVFRVAVVKADGFTSSPGVMVALSSQGMATFDTCGATTCRVATGPDGMVSTTVTPLAAGVVTLTAQALPGSVTASFNAILPPRMLRVISTPSDGALVGDVAAIPLAFELVESDGVTTVPGENVTLSVTVGQAAFQVCSGSPVCTFLTDSNGLVSTSVMPLRAGSITLQAKYGDVLQTATFLAVSKPDTLKLLSAPAGTVAVGVQAGTAVKVQVLGGDGVTPVPGESVLFAASAPVLFSACGASSCTVITGTDGTASSLITPQTAGPVAVTATEAALVVRATFAAAAQPRTMRVLSTPADGSLVGDPAGAPFSVSVTEGDGVTPVRGTTVTMDVTNGKALLSACEGRATCMLTTDANGKVSSSVEPLTASEITLVATDGELVQSVSFAAMAKPDTISILNAPSGVFAVGAQVPQLLIVRVLAGDGVSAAPGRTIVFTADRPVRFGVCGQAMCSVVTDADGTTSTSVTPLAPGIITLTAAEGTLSASTSFTAALFAADMQVVSAPQDGSLQGERAGVAFAVRILDGDGTTPAAGEVVTFSTASGTAQLGTCRSAGPCTAISDSNGIAQISVQPTSAGTVVLLAKDGALTASATFTAQPRPDVVRLLSAPSGSLLVGDAAPVLMAVQVMLGDGTTPAAGRTVVFSAVAGGATFDACSAATCTLTTDVSGAASTPVRASVPGAITVQAAVSGVTKTTSLLGIARIGTLTVGSAPADGAYTGDVAALPFSVHVTTGDEISAAQGENVTLTVTKGNAALGACDTATCRLITDKLGNVTTTVTPHTAGPITLTASAGAAEASAAFLAVEKADRMSLTSEPAAAVYEGDVSAMPLAVRLLLPDGITPAAGMPVLFTPDPASSGKVTFEACAGSSCTIMTDGNGVAGSLIRGVSAGALVLHVTPDAASHAQGAQFAMKVVANTFAVDAVQSAYFVAEGSIFQAILSASARRNGAFSASLDLAWHGSAGMQPLVSTSQTDAIGQAQVGALAGPFLAGQKAIATACGWSNVCATFVATGVGEDAITLEFLSGSEQTVAAGTAFRPVVARVSDGRGHAVAGAAVNVYETVRGPATACPGRGRCPVAPVLASRATAAISDGDGLVTLEPLAAGGDGISLEIDVTAGTHAALISTLLRTQ